MQLYEVKKSEIRSWQFMSIKGIKNIKENAILQLKSLPSAFNINGKWDINELVEGDYNNYIKKYITSITV